MNESGTVRRLGSTKAYSAYSCRLSLEPSLCVSQTGTQHKIELHQRSADTNALTTHVTAVTTLGFLIAADRAQLALKRIEIERKRGGMRGLIARARTRTATGSIRSLTSHLLL